MFVVGADARKLRPRRQRTMRDTRPWLLPRHHNDEISFLFLFAFPFLLLFHFACSFCAACLLFLRMHTRGTKEGAQIPDICAQCALVTCVSVLVTYVSVLVTNTIIPDHHVRLLTQKNAPNKKSSCNHQIDPGN